MAQEPLAPERALRLFVALLLPEAWHTHLAATSQRLERRAPGCTRWVQPRLLHLTLVFLGYQPVERLPAIASAAGVAAAAVPPFELGMGKLGSFGSASRPRVIWVDVVDRVHVLGRIHRRLVDALTEQDIHFDRRELVPHITLGRARDEAPAAAAQRMREALAATGGSRERSTFTASSISLMRSILSRGGPEYVELEQFPLGGA